MTDRWNLLADQALAGRDPSPDEALELLRSEDAELLLVLHAAFRVRQQFYGRDVRVHVLQNAKSGLCPEDCAFCSQSIKHHTGVERDPLLTVEDLVDGARRAAAIGAAARDGAASSSGRWAMSWC